MSSSRCSRSPGESRLLVRLLDPTRRLDYVLLALFAAFPLVLSLVAGQLLAKQGHNSKIECSIDRQYDFFCYSEHLNFTSLVLFLPALLFIIRWAMGRIAPVNETWPPSTEPAILGLLETPASKKIVYEALRLWLLSPRIVYAAVLVTVLVHVVDMREFLTDNYFRMNLGEHGINWRNLHLSGDINMWHQRSSEEPGRMEEERRLCYVGITRAREQLVVTSAEVRRLYGNENYNMLSRFVREIPDELKQEIRPKAQFSRPVMQAPSRNMGQDRAQEDTGLAVGQRVNHARFGDGVVINLEGQGAQSRVQVNFEKEGSKWLIASMANLQPA